MFSVVGTTPTTRIGALEQRDRAHRADDGGAAGHVVLHPLHAVGRLDRDAAGVEGDALADEAEHRRRRRARRIVPHARSRAAARRCRARRRAAVPSRAARSPSRRGPRRARPASFAIAAARSANTRGVSTFDGSFASSRARLLDSPRMRPALDRASRAPAAGACPSAARPISSLGRGPEALAGLVFVDAERRQDQPFGHRLDRVGAPESAPRSRNATRGIAVAARQQRRRGRELAQPLGVKSAALPAPTIATRRAFQPPPDDGVDEELVQPAA